MPHMGRRSFPLGAGDRLQGSARGGFSNLCSWPSDQRTWTFIVSKVSTATAPDISALNVVRGAHNGVAASTNSGDHSPTGRRETCRKFCLTGLRASATVLPPHICRKGLQTLSTRVELPGQRSETVRRSNLSAIVRELHSRGPLSRSELVARTGLTRSTIRALIGELVETGLLSEERGTSQGAPGRPSPLVQPNAERGVVLALEITVDSLAVAAVGLGGEVLDLLRVARSRDRLSVDETVADLAAIAATVRGRLTQRDPLIGIGVAIVGIVRRADGFVT